MVLNSASEFRPNHTKPYQLPTFTYFPDQPELPSPLTYPPTHLTYPPICPAHPPDFKPIHPDNLPEPKDNLPEPTYNLPEPTHSFRILTKPNQAIPNHTMSSPTKFHNLNQISQF